MQHTQIKRFFKRGTALLLVAVLVLATLPSEARAETPEEAAKRVQVDAAGNGNASKIPGSPNHVTLVAIADVGFVFDHWVATAENGGGYAGTFYGSQITVPIPATGIARFRAYFRLATDPRLGVLVQGNASHANRGSVSGTKVAIDDKTETTTAITATPTKGYEFSHWSVSTKSLAGFSNGVPIYSTGSDYTFYERSMTVTAPPSCLYTFTAEFVPEADAKGVFTKTKLVKKDGTEITGVIPGIATGDAVFNQDGIATQKTTLQATPSNAAYVFDHWELSRDGSSNGQYAANPLTVTVENYRDVYTAVFKTYSESAGGVFLDSSKYIGNAAGSYENGGGYATGEKVYNSGGGAGQTTTLQAFPASDEFVFDHWEKKDAADQFQNYAVSNPCTVEVTSSHDVYHAVFTKVGVTTKGVFVEVNDAGYGTATGGKVYNPALGAGQQTTLQAYPTTDTYVFSHWILTEEGGGDHDPISTSNPYTVSVKNTRDTYTAVFKAVEEGKGVTTKAVLLNADGTITENPSPSPGSTSGDTPRTVNSAKVNQTTLQAFPATNGFIFLRWDLHRNAGQTGEKVITPVSTANPYTVKVSDDNDVYWAVFMATPDNTPVPITPNATGVADAKNFKDVWRKFTDPSYSVTRETLESKAASVVGNSSGRFEQASPVTDNSAALKQLEKELSTKGAALGKDRSEMANLPDAVLVSSQGEDFFTDSIRSVGYLDMADEAVQKRFGKLYDFEILQAVKVTGPTGIDNTVTRTLVWKNTGASYRDRLMLLQFLPNGKQNVVTPVADEDGTLTFTLSSVADPDFLLLRIFLIDGGTKADQ